MRRHIMFFILFFMHVSLVPVPCQVPKVLLPNWMVAEDEMAKTRATFFATPCSQIATRGRASLVLLSDEASYYDPLMRRNARSCHAFRPPNHHTLYCILLGGITDLFQ